MPASSPAASDEDVHTLIDRLLHEEIGDVASKLHTGRSRNDQVATATRLWSMEAATRLDAAVRGLQRVMIDQAHGLETALMPSYTHMQRAIPVSARALAALAFLAARARSRAASRRVSARRAFFRSAPAPSPAARIRSRACCCREASASARISPNSIDAVSDRDFVAELLFSATMIATHLSRLAEDLIIYGSSEFGFVQFGDAYTSGSSMMPQKRNPDALELARGSAARMLGDLTTLLATLKGLADAATTRICRTTSACCSTRSTRCCSCCRPSPARSPNASSSRSACDAALSSTMMATDLADYLVRKGATFREAHGAVGRLVRQCEEEKLGASHACRLPRSRRRIRCSSRTCSTRCPRISRWSNARWTAGRARRRARAARGGAARLGIVSRR